LSGRLFGTDGIRARFGEPPLVEATVRRIGRELGALLRERGLAPTVLLGGDTRASSPRLADWIAEGLVGSGARAVELGVVPTAAVARLVPARGAAAGVVLSASHNPAEDNGIKLIGPDGFKWSLADEDELERRLSAAPESPPSAAGLPAIERDPDAVADYVDRLVGLLPSPRPLRGLRVALDCANGAASGIAPPLFERLGASVESTFDRPDGANINRDCGSTHPAALVGKVRPGGFDLGVAFDGDADRALLVDERGELRDGDAMMYLWAVDLARRGELEPRELVATSMSNLGLERALAREGIGLIRCGVGDREVVETLRAHGARLGGEQSGHIVDLALSTTGDGLLTALSIAAIVAAAGRPVSELLGGFRRYPQRLINVHVRARPALSSLPRVAAAAAEVERRLGADGRLVLRYSGTEPLARVMIEGPDDAVVDELGTHLADAIRAEIGAE
jgi:phosphoglucosamine mutase